MLDFEAENLDDELLSAYLDDELAPEERARVAERLAADPAARQLLDELRAVSLAMKDVPRATLDADLRESVLRQAERAMLVSGERVSDFGELSRVARGLNEIVRKFPFGRSRRAWAWAGATLAAGLLVMVFVAEPERDKDLPNALAKREAPALDDRMSRLEMRAAEEPPNEDEQVAASATTAAPPADSVSAPGPSTDVLAENVGGGGGFGGAVVSGRQSTLETGGELLVVHVNMKPEAFERGAIDELLRKNRIEVEDPSAGKSTAQQPSEVDVVLVQAAPKQIYGCLTDMDADRTNYLGIAVDDELSVSEQTRAANAPAADLKQFNRGSVPGQQKVQLAPNNNYYYQTGRGQIEIDRGLSEERVVEQQILGKDEQQLADRGRAVRFAPQSSTQAFSAEQLASGAPRAGASMAAESTAANDLSKSGGDKYGLTRRAMQKLATKADTLQVLFILSAGEEPAPAIPAASPTTSPPADDPVR